WFDTQLVRLPPDLDGDGRIGPNDGVVILVDGQPYEGIWDLDPRGILSLLEVGPAEGRMVRRGSRIVVRYPRPCEQPSADDPGGGEAGLEPAAAAGGALGGELALQPGAGARPDGTRAHPSARAPGPRRHRPPL